MKNYGDFIIVHNGREYQSLYLFENIKSEHLIYEGVFKNSYKIFAVRDNIYGVGGPSTDINQAVKSAVENCEKQKLSLEFYRMQNGSRKRL